MLAASRLPEYFLVRFGVGADARPSPAKQPPSDDSPAREGVFRDFILCFSHEVRKSC